MKPPLLDKRTRAEVLAQALTLAGRNPPIGWTGYVPEWAPPADEPDPGQRLLESFARLAELVIERLNRVPENNFLSFLEFAGVERFPGASAQVPVTFVVSNRAPVGGIVPAGTQVATTQTKQSDARVFETRRDFFASLARLQSMVAVMPATDRYVVLPTPPTIPSAASLAASMPIRVMTAAEPALGDIQHALFLGSEQLFGRKDAIDVMVQCSVISGTFPTDVVWRRFDKQAKTWVDLTPPIVVGGGGPNISFTFPALRDVAKTSVDGVQDFWIAAFFTGGVAAIATPPVLSSITGSLVPSAPLPASLDAAFYNGAPLDLSKPFHPFGRRPAYGDAFYFASDAAFAPGNSNVSIGFDIAPYVHSVLTTRFNGLPAAMTVRTTARWQYLNAGGQWIDLATFDHEFQFTTAGIVTRVPMSPATPVGAAGDGVLVGTADGDATVQVTFASLPADVGRREVNGVENHWLRVLLTSENPYGIDGVVTGTGTGTRFLGPLFIEPRIEGIHVTFAPHAASVPIARARALNNFDWSEMPSPGAAIVPYVSPEQRRIGTMPVFGSAPALYVSFDRALEADAFVSLFIDLDGPGSSLVSPLESGQPGIAFEYWSQGRGWRPLDVTDDSLNLTTSGTVAFVAPRDAAPAALFANTEAQSPADATPRWWMRARLAAGGYDYPPAVRGAYLNTVAAENRTTVPEVLIGSSNGEPDQTFVLVKGPVLSGDVWVRETERPSADELHQLDIEHAEDEESPMPSATTPSPNVRDVGGGDPEVWVRWRRVPNFRLSGPRSRHYLLDSVAAIVQFGNGTSGHIPVVGRNNLVFRDLQTGGGASVNQEVKPLSVKELKTSLPFIDKVFNVQAASAGASPWTIEQFEEFGPQSLKNRGRAVTTEDYEWMIRQRFSDVARVRCMPVREPGPGGALRFKAGGVTALVVPWSTEPRPQPTQGLIQQVRDYLAHVVLTNISADVHVKGPDYVAVDIAATIVPKRPELAIVVMRKASAALEAFLHPLTGGEDGGGYTFGRDVYLSEVQAELERIDEIDHVVSAHFIAVPGADQFPVDSDHLASSGTHQITVLSVES